LDFEKLYSIKLFKSLEEIVYLADSEFLESYGENIVKCYESIIQKTDKKSVRNKILRNIYDLNSSSISISSDSVKLNNNNNSYPNNSIASISSTLSQISITTDKNNTKVQFSSADSLNYSYEYDGETLEIVFFDISINSKNNSITPKEGSGIKSLNWNYDKTDDRLSIKLKFNDNYDMNFEELVDNFEKSDKYSEKYHLLLNISLPDEDIISLSNYSVKDRLKDKGKRKKYTIILDPGHGGDDPGAIGVKKKRDGKTKI